MYKLIGFSVRKHVEDSNLPLDIIHPFNNSKIPPWKLIKYLYLNSKKLREKTPVFKQKLAEIEQSKHPEIEIYTDGSKDNNKVAAAAIINHDVFSVRLPNEATIFTAEAKAIQLAFELIKMLTDIHFKSSMYNKVIKPCNFNLKRTDDVIISRIRIGHSRITQSYLLKGEQQPECISIDYSTVIFRVFRHLSRTRLIFGNLQTMQELFTKFDIDFILQFLKGCDFYRSGEIFF